MENVSLNNFDEEVEKRLDKIFPEDNLNLANIIKSPIIGLKEDDLFELCIRNKISL